jgi:alanine racemase
LPHPRFDLARPGAGLYGVNPCPGLPHPLKPVVSLALPVLQVQLAQAGDYVGYGAQTRLERASRLVVVAGGYADGFFRAAFPALKAYADDSVGQVHALPLAGRVSMDALVFDATDCPDLREGMQVRLLGPEQTVDALAAAAGTIGYEVLTGLGERLRRRYLPVLP